MKNKDLISALSRLDPELEVIAEESVVEGAFKSTYDDDSGTHDCIELDLAEFEP